MNEALVREAVLLGLVFVIFLVCLWIDRDVFRGGEW